jgi:hypothetical protein
MEMMLPGLTAAAVAAIIRNVWLRGRSPALRDHAEHMVDLWRAKIGARAHLAHWFFDAQGRWSPDVPSETSAPLGGALARCCWGLMPRTRLNAALKANGVAYPTFSATVLTVSSALHSRSAAMAIRQFLKKVIGDSPTRS